MGDWMEVELPHTQPKSDSVYLQRSLLFCIGVSIVVGPFLRMLLLIAFARIKANHQTYPRCARGGPGGLEEGRGGVWRVGAARDPSKLIYFKTKKVINPKLYI
jgi:hypothetical protein